MRIGIQTWGSEGDLRPLLALAAGLVQAGHDVILAAGGVDHVLWQQRSAELGVSYLPAPERTRFDLPSLHRRVADPGSLDWAKVLLQEAFYPHLDEIVAAAEAVCAESDLVIGHSAVHPLRAVARRSGTPYVGAALCPALIPSEHQPPGGLPDRGPALNRLAWRQAHEGCDTLLKPDVERCWQQLGQKPPAHALEAGLSDLLNLVAVSPTLCPAPPDWGSRTRVCGCWELPREAWTMPARLAEFFDHGEPPVYLTLGSMLPLDPTAMLGLLLQGVKLAGCRALVQAPASLHASLGPSPDTASRVRLVDRLPHDQVFPRCAAIVHHGGAGTCHAAVRAGCPSVVVAVQEEQWFWGQELQRAAAASAPLRLRETDAERLAAAIRTVLSAPRLKRRTAALSTALAGEDGVGQAITWIEELVEAPRLRSAARPS